jgi:hypothetical protein
MLNDLPKRFALIGELRIHCIGFWMCPFSEDANRTRKGHAPENYSILRHIALNILRKDTTSKKSIKLKRLRAGWDTDYLEQLLDVLQAA